MTARQRTYEPKRDFLRVRDFLNQTYAAFPLPVNWNWVAPVATAIMR